MLLVVHVLDHLLLDYFEIRLAPCEVYLLQSNKFLPGLLSFLSVEEDEVEEAQHALALSVHGIIHELAKPKSLASLFDIEAAEAGDWQEEDHKEKVVCLSVVHNCEEKKHQQVYHCEVHQDLDPEYPIIEHVGLEQQQVYSVDGDQGRGQSQTVQQDLALPAEFKIKHQKQFKNGLHEEGLMRGV